MSDQAQMGELELNSEATEALQALCNQSGVEYDSVKDAMASLYAACVYTIEQIAELFQMLSSSIAESVAPAVQAIQGLLDSQLFFMVPPHIRHLAYNHPKARVRNKNYNRMWKIRERHMKCYKI